MSIHVHQAAFSLPSNHFSKKFLPSGGPSCQLGQLHMPSVFRGECGPNTKHDPTKACLKLKKWRWLAWYMPRKCKFHSLIDATQFNQLLRLVDSFILLPAIYFKSFLNVLPLLPISVLHYWLEAPKFQLLLKTLVSTLHACFPNSPIRKGNTFVSVTLGSTWNF